MYINFEHNLLCTVSYVAEDIVEYRAFSKIIRKFYYK